MTINNHDAIVSEIMQARSVIRMLQKDVKYILITDDDTDYTSRLESGEYVVYLTRQRFSNGHFAAVFPAVIHQLAHIKHSNFDIVPAINGNNLSIIEELRVNYFITRRYPGITERITALYPESERPSFSLLSKLSRNGYSKDVLPSHLSDDEKDYVLFVLTAPSSELEPHIIAHYKKAKDLLDSEEKPSAILDEVASVSGFEVIGSDMNQSCLTEIAKGNSKQIFLGDSVRDLNVQLVAAQYKEDVKSASGASSSNQLVVDWCDEVMESQIDGELFDKFVMYIRARNSERSDFIHGVDSGLLSMQKLHLAPLAMRGATRNIFRRRGEGLLSRRYGVLLDVSGSMSSCIDRVSIISNTFAEALKEFGKGNVVYGVFSDNLIISIVGFPKSERGGAANGKKAITEFANFVDKMIVVSDSEFSDSDYDLALNPNVEIIGVSVGDTNADLPFEIINGDWEENFIRVCKEVIR